MPDETTSTYTLADLCDLADVTPRTVRYYIQQGLLRSPEVAGPSTRYDEGHLWRLRLIRQLQREHLPLAEIRNRLSALTDDEARALTGGQSTAIRESAIDYITGILDSRGVRGGARPAGVSLSMPMAVPSPAPFAASQPPSKPVLSGPAGSVPTQPDRSQWERVALTPDVELHIRRPLSRDHNRRVDRLISIARQLLEEDTP
jgi:DNA-binding transcriptional MerR regulator